MLPLLLSFAALPLAAQASDVPGIMSFPIRGSVGAPLVRDIGKRQNDIILENELTGTIYTIDISIGTPGQTISVNFDTGSDELWVNPVCDNAFDPALCQQAGHYTESTTFVDLQASGGIQYGIGFVEFEYGYDVISIGSSVISQQIFGVATNSDSIPVGILGVGPSLNGWDSPYPYVIDSLVEQGQINSRLFSLDLRGVEGDGSIVFGGVDTAKFSGELETLPIVPAGASPDGQTRYWVNLDGITVTHPDGQETTVLEGTSQTVLLDSGYTLSGLPGPIFQSFLAAFPEAQLIPGSDQYSVDCALAEADGFIDFTFGGTDIHLPYKDFIWQQPQAGQCYLGIFQSDTLPVLGDTFLRAAYVVYDWDNRNILIANNEDCGTNLVPIAAGAGSANGLSGLCDSSNPTGTSSAPPSTSHSSTLAPTSSATSSPPAVTTTTTAASSSSSPSSSSSSPSSLSSSADSTSGWSNSTTSAHSSTVSPTSIITTTTTTTTTTPPPHNGGSTSTYTGTTTYTITSCPPYVVDCPIGSVTTSTFTGPAPTTTTTPPRYTTSTYSSTKTYTITSCPPTVFDCPVGAITSEVVTATTLVCPEITATYTLPNTYTCTRETCAPTTNTATHIVVTVTPQPTYSVPTHIPGAPTGGAPTSHPPALTTPAPVVPAPPPGGFSSVTRLPTETGPAPPVVTAGAAAWSVPGIAALGCGAFIAALL